jgi:FkbM family methyltransferase
VQFALGAFRASQQIENIPLPWGHTITVFPDVLGKNILATGIFDISETETIQRLLDPGGVAVDVGANVGYFTSLMASRLGAQGTVIALEPHPAVFALLEQNIATWSGDSCIGTLEVHRVAASNEVGLGRLAAHTNLYHMGIASLRQPSDCGSTNDYQVDTVLLDEVLDDRDAQLLKIDVEGHEHAALIGAERLLTERRVRDIVFEDWETYPTPTMKLLEHYGFSLFTLDHSLFGLRVHPVEEGPAPLRWPGRNYLATLNPARALARLRRRGWISLRTRRQLRSHDLGQAKGGHYDVPA